MEQSSILSEAIAPYWVLMCSEIHLHVHSLMIQRYFKLIIIDDIDPMYIGSLNHIFLFLSLPSMCAWGGGRSSGVVGGASPARSLPCRSLFRPLSSWGFLVRVVSLSSHAPGRCAPLVSHRPQSFSVHCRSEVVSRPSAPVHSSYWCAFAPLCPRSCLPRTQRDKRALTRISVPLRPR